MENIWNQLPHPFLILAPMEGVTDIVFRQVIARAGAPHLFFTEFTNVSSYASEKGRPNALERLLVAPGEGTLSSSASTSALKSSSEVAPALPSSLIPNRGKTPIIAQIWGKNPLHFAETASALASLGFNGLDINMGCPDKHVVKAGGGSAMIKTPELAISCIQSAKAHTSLPISVKTRLGFSTLDEYEAWISLLLKQHLYALTIHLRTRKEMSKVPAHYELIPNLLKLRHEFSPETKLIINGDIKDAKHASDLSAKYPELDGFMLGRAVFSNPYCFTNHVPTPEELKNLFLYHLDLYDFYQPLLHLKFEPLKHFYKIYFSNQPGSSDLRAKLMDCKTTDALRETIARTTI